MLQAHIYELMIQPLNRHRTVTVFLPKHYNQNKTYPLLIMHDGQNLAEFSNGSLNKWGIDHYQKNHENSIIIGINCDSKHRLNEYAPFNVEKRGLELLKDYPLQVDLVSEGKLYIHWIVEELIPLLKSKYPINSHIGIAGSSMGGIISLYALISYPNIFNFAGVISPAYWFSDQVMIDFIHKHPLNNQTIYTSVGTNEGGIAYAEDYVNCFKSVNQALKNHAHLIVEVIQDGIHNESAWSHLVKPMMDAFLGKTKRIS